MGHYGANTTCQLCGYNHPTRTDAIGCADRYWKRAGYAGFRDADTLDIPYAGRDTPARVVTEDGETITHEPTPPITVNETLDTRFIPDDVFNAFFREVARGAALGITWENV